MFLLRLCTSSLINVKFFLNRIYTLFKFFGDQVILLMNYYAKPDNRQLNQPNPTACTHPHTRTFTPTLCTHTPTDLPEASLTFSKVVLRSSTKHGLCSLFICKWESESRSRRQSLKATVTSLRYYCCVDRTTSRTPCHRRPVSHGYVPPWQGSRSSVRPPGGPQGPGHTSNSP